MYEIGDEIYCLIDFKEFKKGSYYRITGFYSAADEFQLTELYFFPVKYRLSMYEIKLNFISIEEYKKIKQRDIKINQILQSS